MSIERQLTNQRMSQITIHEKTVYLAGQVPQDTDATLQDQTRSVLEKIDNLLSQAQTDRNNLLAATIYLRDMKDFAAMNEIWDSWLPEGHAPTRTCVEARLARPNVLVEITVIAAR